MEHPPKKHFEKEESGISTITPFIESFFDNTSGQANWSKEIAENESFIEQVESRKKVLQAIEQVVTKLPSPDTSLEQALNEKIFNENEIINLFSSLTELLESGLDYERIVLYLPFEFLPDTSWQSESLDLKTAILKFKEVYMQAWKTLLSSHDVRANFVDGDVLEVDLRGEIPRVVKAAHLIPILVKKGMLSVDEVLKILDESDDTILKQNINEALLVMADMNLIPKDMIPEDLPIVKHFEETTEITERRKKWLEEKEKQKKSKPLTKIQDGADKLKKSFSENLKESENEVEEIKKVIELIKSDEKISEFIYPVVMISGSRLKGYGTSDSDFDIGIFIKPGVDIDNRLSISEKIREIFSTVKNFSEPIEFWLENSDGMLKVKTVGNDALSAESFQVQFLLGSVWEGDEGTIKELQEKLLTQYFYKTDEKIYGQDARKMYLGELERDALQYRLMHKGYERFFPTMGGIKTEHSDRIDGQSMFYDSGYRQLATELYLKRVFLPEI